MYIVLFIYKPKLSPDADFFVYQDEVHGGIFASIRFSQNNFIRKQNT